MRLWAIRAVRAPSGFQSGYKSSSTDEREHATFGLIAVQVCQVDNCQVLIQEAKL